MYWILSIPYFSYKIIAILALVFVCHYTLSDLNLYKIIITDKDLLFLLVGLPTHIVVGFLLLIWRFKYRVVLALLTTLFVGFVFKRYINGSSFWEKHGQSLIKRVFILFLIGLSFRLFVVYTDVLPRSWYVLSVIFPNLLFLLPLEDVLSALFTPSYMKGTEGTTLPEQPGKGVDVETTTEGKGKGKGTAEQDSVAEKKTKVKPSKAAANKAMSEIDSIKADFLKRSGINPDPSLQDPQSSSSQSTLSNPNTVAPQDPQGSSSQSTLSNPNTVAPQDPQGSSSKSTLYDKRLPVLEGDYRRASNLLRQNLQEMLAQNKSNTERFYSLQKEWIEDRSNETLKRLEIEKDLREHRFATLRDSYEQKLSLEQQITQLKGEFGQVKRDHVSNLLLAGKYDLVIELLKDEQLINDEVQQFMDSKAREYERFASQKLAEQVALIKLNNEQMFKQDAILAKINKQLAAKVDSDVVAFDKSPLFESIVESQGGEPQDLRGYKARVEEEVAKRNIKLGELAKEKAGNLVHKAIEQELEKNPIINQESNLKREDSGEDSGAHPDA